MLLRCGDHLRYAYLDPEIYDLVAVVGEDDVHQVLPDVMDVPLNGGQDDRALPALVDAFHMWFEESDCCLHGLGRREHEGELHLSGGEQVTDCLHACQEDIVNDAE